MKRKEGFDGYSSYSPTTAMIHEGQGRKKKAKGGVACHEKKRRDNGEKKGFMCVSKQSWHIIK